MKRIGLVAVAAAVLASPAPATAQDPYSPVVRIDSGPAGATRIARPTFEFSSPGNPGAEFECSVNGGSFRACESPYRTGALGEGSHTFRVLAVIGSDRSAPAARTFRIDRNVTGVNASSRIIQRVRGRKLALVVKVTADEPVRASAAGRLRIGKRSYAVTSAEATLEGGATRRLIVRPRKPAVNRKARRALKKGKRVEARLAATFTDAVGNRATTGQIDIKLKR